MTEKDYYAILGIEKNADEKKIKQAYRRLAKKYHPDTNAGNARAEQRFKEVTEAYDILGDAKKRALYDKYGCIAFTEGFDPQAYEAYQNAQRSGGGFGGSSGFGNGFGGGAQSFRFNGQEVDEDTLNDILGGMFGGFGSHGSSFGGGMHFGRGGFTRRSDDRADAAPADTQATLRVTLEEAALGCDKEITLSGGDGKRQKLQVHVPAGIDTGQKIRLKGRGGRDHRGRAGDLYLEIEIAPKKDYERKGLDLYVTVQIPFVTAALGGEAVIPTLYGNVSCRIPAGTQSGSKIRLKGKGIRSMKNVAEQGDEYAVIQIAVPKVLTEAEKEKLAEFGALRGEGSPSGKGSRAA